MIKTPAIVVFWAWFAITPLANAASGTSALNALAVLPPDAARSVAAIIGCEGNPNPERWRFLVWDAYAENGFREWVVADGKIVTRNIVSQFASRVSPMEVIAPEAVQVDSDAAGSLALQYAKANNIAVSTLRYSLRRTPEVTIPIWKVDCYDEGEQQVGSISVAAGDGKVLARLGFINEPNQAGLTAALKSDRSKQKSPSSRQSAGSKSSARRAGSGPQPEAVAERFRRATPTPRERKPPVFRLFRFGRD